MVFGCRYLPLVNVGVQKSTDKTAGEFLALSEAQGLSFLNEPGSRFPIGGTILHCILPLRVKVVPEISHGGVASHLVYG